MRAVDAAVGVLLCVTLCAGSTRFVRAEDVRLKDGGERITVENAARVDLLKTLSGPTDWARCVAWEPGTARVYSGCKDGVIYIWDTASGELPMRVRVAAC